MADNLKRRTISGVVWSAIHKFANVLLGFISGIVLARLLTPHDYGVIGMLTIFLAVSNTFIDGGFGSALIQKKNATEEDYSTIFFWNLGLSVFLYLVLFACAPLIASFYNLPLLSDVLRVEGLVLIINAARIVQHNQLRKRLEFKKVALINVSSHLFALIMTIYLAWSGWGVWALVAQQLLVGALATVFYWIVGRWRPLLVFSNQSFKELFSFGGFILLSNLFNTLCNNIQGLLIGKAYNADTLGYYTKARVTEGYASTLISNIVEQVCYPVFSETQDNKVRMISVLRKFIGVTAFVTYPLMILLIVLAKPIILLLYSEKWLPCVPYFQILCLAGLAVSLQNINYYAIAAIGYSKTLFKWTIIKRTLGLLVVFGGLFFFGIYGILWGTVITYWIIYLVNAGLVSKHIGYSGWQQFKDLIPIILISFVSAFLAYSVSYLLNYGVYTEAVLELLFFCSFYLFTSIFVKVDACQTTNKIIKKQIYKLILIKKDKY